LDQRTIGVDGGPPGKILNEHAGERQSLALLGEPVAGQRQDTSGPALHDLQFLGCAGIRVLLDAANRCRRHNLEFSVLATSRAVLRPLLLTGLDRTLNVVSTDPPQTSSRTVPGPPPDEHETRPRSTPWYWRRRGI
jgi:hypothetical protein